MKAEIVLPVAKSQPLLTTQEIETKRTNATKNGETKIPAFLLFTALIGAPRKSKMAELCPVGWLKNCLDCSSGSVHVVVVSH